MSKFRDERASVYCQSCGEEHHAQNGFVTFFKRLDPKTSMRETEDIRMCLDCADDLERCLGEHFEGDELTAAQFAEVAKWVAEAKELLEAESES